ncbi:MAG: autotransporter outer membrane beta-barrel domain-containing protein [Opitutaceae bacterium]|nr:autotransporter outer membrane beta-barrel domain-containing protein [Opitutaceae bacterium]
MLNLSGLPFGAAGVTTIAGDLAGTGTIVMDVNLRTGEAQTLRVTGAASGTHAFAFNNQTTGEVDKPQRLRLGLVRIDGANDATFEGVITDHAFNVFTVQQRGGETFLAYGGQTALAEAVLSTTGILGADWHYSLDSLRSRLGELRHRTDTTPPASGWVRANAYHLDADRAVAGDAFGQDTYEFSSGMDRALPLGRATLHAGGYGVFGRSERDYDRYGAGRTIHLGLGLYASWLHASGLYVDLVARVDRYENRLVVHEADGFSTEARYNSAALGFSAEAGWRLALWKNLWLEPSLSAAAARLTTPNYETDDGLGVIISDATSAQYRAQLRLGADLGRWQPHLRLAGVDCETSGGQVLVYGDTYTPKVDGWRVEAGTGFSFLINDTSQVYFDYEYNKADTYTRPWALNLGYRHAW